MEKIKKAWLRTPKLVRQVLVMIVGLLVILAGIAMLALPGQGILTILLGLAILSTEFPWAERMRDWTIHKFKSAYHAVKRPKKTKK